jgi:predicted small lipoprotein YifL
MLACVCLAMISACGMQGDLYLPEDKAGESQQNGSN